MAFIMKGFDASLEPPSSSDVSAHVSAVPSSNFDVDSPHRLHSPPQNSRNNSMDFPALPEPTAQKDCCQEDDHQTEYQGKWEHSDTERHADALQPAF